MSIPRPEHPKPQFERKNWMNLNGTWQFSFDHGLSAQERKLYLNDAQFDGTITVPFCPQSKLSGVQYTDFIRGIVYRRAFCLTEEQVKGRTFLHFGAVDYECVVYVNEKEVGRHRGGYISFSFDITEFVGAGENTVTLFAYDNERDPLIPRGKQCEGYYSAVCDYTRTTGIWQTVWLEFTPMAYIKSAKFYPDVNGKLTVIADLCGKADLRLEAFYEGELMGEVTVPYAGQKAQATIDLAQIHLWEVGCGRLYDLKLTYGDDEVYSYFGLRSIALDGYRFLLNGKSVFQRTILDQGFYPDGIYTAPTDGDLIRDIELSLACGFNGARLHQKIFEERFLYHADKMGYIVWGEFPDWGLAHNTPDILPNMLNEWMQEINRDFNHPAIIGWCPHNETWWHDGQPTDREGIRLIYEATKAMDPTRPCIDTSGGFHAVTDIYDVHNYEQNPEVFRTQYEKIPVDGTFFDSFAPDQQKYPGHEMPIFVSEYGGIAWTEGNDGWGYGNGPKTVEEFRDRFIGLTEVLMENPCICGLCYTQLTDVEQEKNGLYRYDRTAKFDIKPFYETLVKKAAIED